MNSPGAIKRHFKFIGCNSPVAKKAYKTEPLLSGKADRRQLGE